MKSFRLTKLAIAGVIMSAVAAVVPVFAANSADSSHPPYNVIEDELDKPTDAAGSREWAAALANAAQKPTPEYLDLQAQVAAAEDELYKEVAADARMKPIQESWVECMGGRFESDGALFDYATAKLTTAASETPEESDAARAEVDALYAQNASCSAPLSSSFDKIVREHAVGWKADHQELFAAYKRALGLTS